MAVDDLERGATADLAAFAAETDLGSVPTGVLDVGTRMVTDTVGVALAARTEPIAARARAGLQSTAETVPTLGGENVGTVRDAALRNGVLAHALDYDDVHEGMGGHPSAPVLAALLPLAHREGGTGEDVLAAFLVGAETEIRVAEALNPGLYERGWHPTSVVGTLGAAVGAATYLDCSEPVIRRAVGVAASEASGIKANFGTMTKPLHVGLAARAGVEAADLAAAGYTASEDALERAFGGFCDLFCGETDPEFQSITESLGDRWAVTEPRPWFKAFPCCGSVHSAIAAATALHDRIDPDAVASIEVVEHPRRLDHTDNPAPADGLAAKFSVQYCVAAGLVDGAVALDHFDTVPREDIQRLAETVTLARDADRFADREYGAAVRVSTDTGVTLTEVVDAPPGSAGNPMSRADFAAKYRRCAGRALPSDRVETSLERLRELDSLSDVAELTDVVCGFD